MHRREAGGNAVCCANKVWKKGLVCGLKVAKATVHWSFVTMYRTFPPVNWTLYGRITIEELYHDLLLDVA